MSSLSSHRAEQLVALLAPLAAAGVMPLQHGAARWLIEAVAVDIDALDILRTLLSLADVLAAQTATLAESGALRAMGGEATALRAQANAMRATRRTILELRRGGQAAK